MINTGKYKYGDKSVSSPVGGPCLIKDTYILNESLTNKKSKPNIALAARKINENLPKDIILQAIRIARRFKNRRYHY